MADGRVQNLAILVAEAANSGAVKLQADFSANTGQWTGSLISQCAQDSYQTVAKSVFRAARLDMLIAVVLPDVCQLIFSLLPPLFRFGGFLGQALVLSLELLDSGHVLSVNVRRSIAIGAERTRRYSAARRDGSRAE